MTAVGVIHNQKNKMTLSSNHMEVLQKNRPRNRRQLRKLRNVARHLLARERAKVRVAVRMRKIGRKGSRKVMAWYKPS